MKAGATVLAFMLAATMGPSMKKQPPNWGRSFPLSALTTGNTVELVRLDLETSHDVTLYLGDIGSSANPTHPEIFNVSFANGGTSMDFEVLGAMVGSVVHVVAKTVIVRAQKYPAVAGIIPNVSPRVSAMAALGRPFRNAQRVDANVGAGTTFLMVPLMAPWTSQLQITSWPSGAGALVNVLYIDTVGTKHYADFQKPIELFADPQYISPLCNAVEIVTALTGVRVDLAMLRDI
jgi:hypothetical protein